MEISQHLIEGVLLMIAGGLGKWNWNQAKDLKDMAAQLKETQLDLAKNYPLKEEMRKIVYDAVAPVMRQLERVERTLERVADREED